MSLLSLSASRSYYLHQGATNMRKSFNGLSALIRAELGQDPLSGNVFIFFNRQRDQVKLLLFEQDGFGIFHKRLEKGTFELPKTTGESTDSLIAWQDLQFILQGVELTSIRLRKRYHRHTAAA
jgi:transposase